MAGPKNRHTGGTERAWPQRIALTTLLSVALFTFASCGLIENRIEREVDAYVEDVLDTGSGLNLDGCAIASGMDVQCGGELEGLWRVVGYCPLADSYDPLRGLCPGFTASAAGRADGMLRFLGDGTYTWTWNDVDLDLDFRFPLECFGGDPGVCEASNFDARSCQARGGDCECEGGTAGGDYTESGYYEYNSLGSLVLWQGSESRNHDYCVQRDELLVYRMQSELDLLPFVVRLERVDP